jgi:hypothetical protein
MRNQPSLPGKLRKEREREVLPAGWKEVSHWIMENWIVLVYVLEMGYV